MKKEISLKGEKRFQQYFKGMQDYVYDFKFENKIKTFHVTHSLKSSSHNQDPLTSTEYNMDSSRLNPWSHGQLNTDSDLQQRDSIDIKITKTPLLNTRKTIVVGKDPTECSVEIASQEMESGDTSELKKTSDVVLKYF